MISVYKKFLSLIVITLAIWIIVFNHDAWAKPHIKNYMSFICHNLNTNIKTRRGFQLIELEKDVIRTGQIRFDIKKKKVSKNFKNYSLHKHPDWDYGYYKDNLVIQINEKETVLRVAYIDLINSSLTFPTGAGDFKFSCTGFRNKNIFKDSIRDIEAKIQNKKFKNYYNPLFNSLLFMKNNPYDY